MDNLAIRMKEKLKLMLNWYDSFCRENRLKYYIVGGTMLGAVRHGGMIPWDDDIDVAMPRPDYEKFLKLTESTGKIFGHYIVESFHSNNEDFIYPYAKIYDIDTTLVEEAWHPLRRGIFIDVFPLDGMSSSEKTAHHHFIKVKRKYDLLCTIICSLNKKRVFYKNMAIIVGRVASKLFLSKKVLLELIDTMSKEYNYYNSDYIAFLVGNWGERELMKKEIFGEPIEYEFEGMKIFGVENYDEYLTKLYGDYMTPPPPEKRVSHHPNLEFSLDYRFGYKK